MELGEKLKTYRKQRGFTQKQVADSLGVNRVSVTQWEIGDARPPVHRIAELAMLYGISADALLSDESMSVETPLVANARFAPHEVPRANEMLKDIPVLGTAAGNHVEGAFQLETHAIDYVRRPPGLSAAKDVYGLYVEGDSMEPKYAPGDLVFVHLGRPARIGDAVVVQFIKAQGDDAEAMIGILAKRTMDDVKLKKYNPAAVIKVKGHILAVHRILSNNELYGL